MKRWLFVLPVVAFIALIAVFGFGLTQDPSKLPSQLIDKPLPAFTLPGLDGGTGFASAGLKGPLLLNVFASWCPSCPQEHPTLTQISQLGVPVYGIAWKDKPEATHAWLAKLGNPYTAVAADLDGRTAIDLGVTGAPETFIVDRHGRVRFKQIGPIMPEVWTGTIEPLLAKLRAER